MNDIASKPRKTDNLSLTKAGLIQPSNSLGTFKWTGKPYNIMGIHAVQNSPSLALLLKYRHRTTRIQYIGILAARFAKGFKISLSTE